MRLHFRITRALLDSVRIDLRRPHPFAHERVGFISAGLSAADEDVLIVAREYRAVLDEDYLRDPTVGAMMGAEAIRKALQWAMQDRLALFHVHTHGGQGLPGFSRIDLRENAKFVPDFLKVTPQCAHGAIVLSDNAARGQLGFDPRQPCMPIDSFAEIGAPIRKWRAA